ncbi:pyrroline-5-carboxylate reductase [Sulfoacidibacillus thermotolerans]|uniref:pyrroline-5-carboxylate reductase n=1 Tax=Sulfoacidibacillus thermotolerans TaxID=1765684 RepID=UPI0015E81DEB|nr:pyrroline-5-carboxylate reductase [Sulfoacidibacillus thermotolerans]
MSADQNVLNGLHITFIGAGSIAEALIKGLSETGMSKTAYLHVTNRSNHERLNDLKATYPIIAHSDLRDAVLQADILILCVKPKDVHSVLPLVARHARADALYLSVVAGCSIESMRQMITSVRTDSGDPHIVRTMPNTSCAVRESATAYTMSKSCTTRDQSRVEAILHAVGRTYELTEDLLNAVTGLAGSGPAYVYYFVEALTRAGVDVGLDEATAYALVLQTLYGAAHMLRASNETPATLRKRVTSPGGTTFAGIATLKQHGFETAVRQAVIRATQRAEELGALLDEEVQV